MTNTLTPVEHTNWALSAWNSTLDRNDVPSAWLYGQDHLWATQDLVCSPGELLENFENCKTFSKINFHIIKIMAFNYQNDIDSKMENYPLKLHNTLTYITAKF